MFEWLPSRFPCAFLAARALRAAIESDEFIELLYATLTAWGMHRMGVGNAKLVEFDEFTDGLHRRKEAIAALDGQSLPQLSRGDLKATTSQVWNIVEGLKLSVANVRIVANSKALHHLLPELIPPIDRTYAYSFFYDRVMLSIPDDEAFSEMFMRFHVIATQASEAISKLIGSGWNTSATKVVTCH